MNRLIILGAGGCGREVLQWALDINKVKKMWDIVGFLDNIDALQEGLSDFPVIGDDDSYEIKENDRFVCAIGNGLVRQKVIKKIKQKGGVFTNLIHPTAIVAETAQLGEGVVLYPYSLISANAQVGDGVIINMYSSVAHDSVVGACSTISAHCDITGACKLGERVFMGTSSHLIPSIKVGNDAFICAGSTVMTRVKPGIKVMGNPAKTIKL